MCEGMEISARLLLRVGFVALRDRRMCGAGVFTSACSVRYRKDAEVIELINGAECRAFEEMVAKANATGSDR